MRVKTELEYISPISMSLMLFWYTSSKTSTTVRSTYRSALPSLHAHADASTMSMLSRRYWLYDITLSDVKEHTVRMNAFLLLIPLFHRPIQMTSK